MATYEIRFDNGMGGSEDIEAASVEEAIEEAKFMIFDARDEWGGIGSVRYDIYRTDEDANLVVGGDVELE